ncbi:MAG: DUF2254 domain-containing protein [Chromatocurvus sp.]
MQLSRQCMMWRLRTMTKLKHYLCYLLGSFWFVPSSIVLGSIVLAIALIEVDSLGDHEWMKNWPRLFGAGAEGARSMLATISGSIMTVVGVTFSMTLMTLALASNQYTSRVLRNFMRDRVTQVVLGVFAGIFTYCLIVLRSIMDSGGGDFIPHLSVAVSMVLAIFGVGVLILFIHHISSEIQASSIISAVAHETFTAIDRLFPDELGQGESEDNSTEPALLADTRWAEIPGVNDGFIQHVDNAVLLRLACEHKTVVRMERGVGEFVMRDSVLVSLAMQGSPGEEVAGALRDCFDVDRYRTLEQDVAFGIRQIVDIAMKALSPSSNDTTTAVMCVNYLTSILSRLAVRKFPSDYRYDEGVLRVIARGPTFGGLLALAFDQVRWSAEGNPKLLVKLIEALEVIAISARNPERRQAVGAVLAEVAEVGLRTLAAPSDRARFESRLAQASARMPQMPEQTG